MISVANGPLNRVAATTSRSLNSQKPQLRSQLTLHVAVSRHPSFWSAKYSHHEGTTTMKVMAKNQRARENSTAFVQVHSKVRRTSFPRWIRGSARSCRPLGSLTVDTSSPREHRSRADYIGRPCDHDECAAAGG